MSKKEQQNAGADAAQEENRLIAERREKLRAIREERVAYPNDFHPTAFANELHARFGQLPVSELLAPAVRYAREGFPVSQVDAWRWEDSIETLRAAGLPAAALENLEKTFTVDGRAPKTGEIVRNQDLARSYERIAAGGRDAFYRGELAQTIALYVERMGGHLAFEDLAEHRGEWVEPVSSTYRGFEVFELPPNGQGIAALQILNILEGYDLAKLGRGSADFWHLLIEAKKLAYEDRARFYADPSYAAAPLEWLLSKEYAAKRRERLRMDRAALERVASAVGGSLTVVTPDDRDVRRLASRVERALVASGEPEGGERWRDAGYWLVPLLVLLSLAWFRRGWTVAYS